MNNTNKVQAIQVVMYGKFNNRNKSMSLLRGTNKGVTVINRPFSTVLADIQEDKVVDIKPYIDNTQDAELTILWEAQIHQNYLNTRGY